MGSTPTCTVDATGIHRPTLAECLAYFTNGYAAVYSADQDFLKTYLATPK